MEFSAESIDLITFDCYGTLIDWEAGILAALKPILHANGVDLSENEILELFGRIEHGIQAEPFRPYREVLERVMVALGDHVGFSPTSDERAALANSISDWPAFPDTVEALSRLHKYVQLAIVSNVDDDLFEGSALRLKTKFDHVITAQQVGSYKPARGHFDEILERTDVPKGRILHAAQSLFHDVAPAGALGFTTAWVNRRGNQKGSGATPPTAAMPDIVVPSMKALADLITKGRV